jgi:ribosome maturation factor RimP
MTSLEEKIFHLIEPICNEEAFFLYKVSLHRSSKNQLIKVVVDTENGVTLDQCQLLSRKISDIFYRKDLIDSNYRLEVSSPGIDKPLEKPFEFMRNIGNTLEVDYQEGLEIISVEGELIAFNGTGITLLCGKKNIGIAIIQIKQAKIKLKW